LIRISWLKKIWNGRSKGISTVLGTVFLTLVIFAISTNVFIWTLSRNAEYTLAVKEENQKTADRINEYVAASGANYSVSGDEIRIKVTLTNAGPVAAQMINLWVFDTTQQKYTNEPVDLSLNPGQSLDLSGVSSLVVTIPGANGSHNFVGWFVTARGNTVPLVQETGIIIAQVSQGIGSIGMEFADFRYYNVSQVGESHILTPYPSGKEGYTIPSGKGNDIAFRVCLTNFDESKEEIKLLSGSVLWMLFPISPPSQPRGAMWYIVNVYDNGTIAPTFTEQVLSYNTPTWVFFASSDSDGFAPSYSGYSGPAAMNLMLVGKIGTSTYGQNVPFVSVYVTE